MQVDHFYKIGDTHDECQDYSLSRIWDNGLAFVCIADGCSSSHDKCRSVDIGARILALSAEYVLLRTLHNQKDLKKIENMFFNNSGQALLGDLIGTFAKNTISQLLSKSLAEYALDSTLLIAVADQNDAFVFVFGDGIVAVEYQNGTKDMYEVKFSNGAPYYLSYMQDDGRRQAYSEMKNFMIIKDIVDVEFKTKCKATFGPESDLNQYYLWPSIKVKNYKRISIMSDGFTSFEDKDKNSIDSGIIVNQAVDFKNTCGVFLQRRMKAMLKKTKREEWSHYDDVSIASITRD